MSLGNVTTEDYDDAFYLSNQVEQAKRRAVLAASDAGAARDRAASAEQAANEAAKRAQRAAQETSSATQDAAEAKAAATEAVEAKGAAVTAKEAAEAAAATSAAAATTAKQEAIADATTKYGGLPTRVAEAEEITKANPPRVRGSLDGTQPLDEMRGASWNGDWTIGSANTNPGLPATPGVVAKLSVRNTANDRYMKIVFRDGAGIYERAGQSTSWFTWSRIDRPFTYQGGLPAGTDLNAMRSSRRWNGIWLINSTSDFPNRPAVEGARVAGMLLHFTTGSGDCYQRVIYRFMGGDVERTQTGASTFTDWTPTGSSGGASAGGDFAKLEARVALLEAAAGAPETTFENNKIFTTYLEGEAYMDRLARAFPSKVKVLDLGESNRGLPIRALELGDPSKPTYYIIAGQHGSEPMGREAALIWARELCEDTSPETTAFLSNYCVVITPTVNADRINVSRLSATGTDLNGNWPTEGTSEITAASSVLKTHNVVITMDAHEGGLWEVMQAEVANAPEVHQAIRDASQALYEAVEADFATAGEAFARFPGSTNLSQARNVIAKRYKSATILFEGSSDLDNNMYSPDVNYRIRVYMLTYRSVFSYVRDHMPDFVAAKAAAQ